MVKLIEWALTIYRATNYLEIRDLLEGNLENKCSQLCQEFRLEISQIYFSNYPQSREERYTTYPLG